MNALLWSLQGLLALLFLLTGTTLLAAPREKLLKRAAWAQAFPPGL